MGLFDFDNFDLEEVVKMPLNQLEADVEFVGDLFTDTDKAFGKHQDAMTEMQGHLGLNKENKIVKNSDAIVGSIFGAVLAGPAVAGAMGSGGGAAAGSTAATTSSSGLGLMDLAKNSLGSVFNSTPTTAGGNAIMMSPVQSGVMNTAAGNAISMSPVTTQSTLGSPSVVSQLFGGFSGSDIASSVGGAVAGSVTNSLLAPPPQTTVSAGGASGVGNHTPLSQYGTSNKRQQLNAVLRNM